MVNECIFCKIINKELPAAIVYEDEYTLAFLDINPVNPGHTLVVPKTHYANIYKTPDDTLAHMIAVSKKIVAAQKESLAADGTNIHVNNDPAAGQVIAHTHFHLIPRLENDGIKLWTQHTYGEGEAERVAAKLKNTLGD